ncbi:hypothetical protein PN498_14055 [Oscillatoria sp. CS-180]|uniref:hypothetical protein n=1 Tax=Oscillatoria sp. CS-180 TaxID=3021720 RepID=UPI002330B58C|nr:hypothetical protein [Oscillatoria sp. CS-180]MDB9527121.1 hypothetical protein [Oscillatoria sp. CS-180]
MLVNVYNGANGTLTLASVDTPEGQDADAVIESYDIRTVGRVTGIEVCVQTDLEEFHEIGRRHAVSLHPGNIHISGKVQRAYINGALLFLLQGRGSLPTEVDEIANPYVQPTFNMTVELSDPAFPGNRAALEIGQVKFQNWSYSLPEDTFVMENATFRAISIRVLDSQAPEGGGGGEPIALAPGFGGDTATA